MSFVHQTIDVGLAVKAATFAMAAAFGAGGSYMAVKSDLDKKADGSAVIRIEAQLAAESKHRDEQHKETMAMLRELRDDLKDKADK